MYSHVLNALYGKTKLDGRRTLTYEFFTSENKLVGTVYGKFKTALQAVNTWAERNRLLDGTVPEYIQAHIRSGLTVRPYVSTFLDRYGN